MLGQESEEAREVRKDRIREALLEQLRNREADKPHYIDLVDDYMHLWAVKEFLIADIKRRGTTYQDRSSSGVPMWKNNPSTKEMLGVHRQMLQILKDLDLTVNKVVVGDGDI